MKIKLIIAAALIIAAFVGYHYYSANNDKPLTAFAQCLKAKGVTFYGAFWCPHCQAQKALFGTAKSELPYVECSTPDANDQTQICKDKHIDGYPTWEFSSSTRHSGEMTIAELAQASGCPAP